MSLAVPVVVLIAAVWIMIAVTRDDLADPRCKDCGAPTPGGRRCWPCADRHVDAIVRYGRFCQAWTKIGIQEVRRSRQVGVYR